MNTTLEMKIPAEFLATCRQLQLAPTRFVVITNIAEQTASLFEDNKFIKTFPCSTSRFGIGQTEGSNRTPLGLHRIAEKIGAGAPAGTVFKSRQAVGHVLQPEFADAKITTRILWLGDSNPASTAAAMWIRTTATFTSTARRTNRASANRPPAAAFTSPTWIWFRFSICCPPARWSGFRRNKPAGKFGIVIASSPFRKKRFGRQSPRRWGWRIPLKKRLSARIKTKPWKN